MRLRDLTGSPGVEDVEITNLAYVSDRVEPGALFFCVSGFKADGHDFADIAVKRGAVALVCERPLGLGVPEVIVDDVRAQMAKLADRFFGGPSDELKVIGITGTNGKTTSAFLLRSVFEAAGWGCGLLGTIQTVIAGHVAPAVRTTPEAIDLQGMFREMLDGGDRVCAMEVSSHALALNRAAAVRFAAAIFTNLTQDHLDFHESMDDYFAAKRKLFELTTGPRVTNIDNAYGRHLDSDFKCISTSAQGNQAHYRALDPKSSFGGTSFICEARGDRFPVEIKLPGHYNIANTLGVIAVAESLGAQREAIVSGLASAAGVPGRFEPVDQGQPFGVIVDYAHTPDSLENVLHAARPLTQGKLIAVFGAGGDRDRGKRPLMGEAAARGSDLAIVTSDNPRSEAPESIVEQVLEGARSAGGDAEVESVIDRRAAIEHACAVAEPGDMVVIAGKGHEQGQEFADGKTIPFDDATVAREAIAVAMAHKST